MSRGCLGGQPTRQRKAQRPEAVQAVAGKEIRKASVGGVSGVLMTEMIGD